ncbi:UDP-sulfoquinovose synthase [Caldiplasma sukawensis]
MKIAILGIDGYIGWPLALNLAVRGHSIVGFDSFYTRSRVKAVGSDSLIDIQSMEKRIKIARENGLDIEFFQGDVNDPDTIYSFVKKYRPEAFVHLAEQRSAPYSMIGLKEARETMIQNIGGTLNLIYAIKDIVPDAHLLKMGTMGEYGTPNIDIPEGFFHIQYKGREDTLPFPKNAGSWYHWSKVHDSNNLMFANKVWRLKITDVMQGVVYGAGTELTEKYDLPTRFDIDEIYGTALNRFCVQSLLGIPISVYGKGNQRRGFISIEDSINCLTLGLEKPPENGEYRVYNQFNEHYSINELANFVKEINLKKYGREVEIKNYENPRVEADEHYYNPEHEKLKALGYVPKGNLREEISRIFESIEKYSEKAEKLRNVILPKTKWKESRGL